MRRFLSYTTPAVTFALFASLILSGASRAQDAAALYKANCVLCHGADGSGTSPTGKALKAKDLRSEEVQHISDADLTTAIANGKGKMPAFGKKIKPEDVKALVTYVRGLAKK